MGELDCREGLLQAVRAAKHASLRSAIEHLADVYVQARRLRRKPADIRCQVAMRIL